MADQLQHYDDVRRALHDSEALNHTVLEASPDCLKILDTEGRLQFMNFNGMCEMEIDDFSHFKSQLWWDLWGNDNKSLVQESVSRALSGEANEFTAYCPTAKGTPKWWHVSVIPVRANDGTVSQILSVSRNITAEKNAQLEIAALNDLLESKIRERTEELLERNIELEKTNAELAMFNHIISHDLQEPLRKIQMFSRQIMADEIHTAHPNLKRIDDATQRMRELIEALNKFSVSKNAKIQFAPCSLDTVIGDAVEHFSHSNDAQNARIAVETFPEVMGSRILLTQVFVNLLENALKYAKPEVAARIEIYNRPAHVVASGRKFHCITVKDNGIGFENQYSKQIFETFRRLHSKEKFRGTGIGLAICKTIVENHGGWIGAESEPGVGSAFSVYLPAGL